MLTPVIPTSGHLTGGVAETFRRSPFRNGGHHRHKSPAREPVKSPRVSAELQHIEAFAIGAGPSRPSVTEAPAAGPV